MVFGLIGVLFAVTIVQTSGILSVSRAVQTAQVKDSTRASGTLEPAPLLSCVVVTPTFNKLVVGDGTGTLTPHESFNMGYTVKNNCTQGINLIDSGTLVGQNTNPALLLGDMQRLNMFLGINGTPVNINPQNNNLGIVLHNETLICLDCNGGIVSYYPSPVGSYNNQGTISLGAFRILPGETKNVQIQVWANIPWQFNEHLRIVPKRMKWFFDSALSNNSVSQTEVITREFTTAETTTATTDFLYGFLYQ